MEAFMSDGERSKSELAELLERLTTVEGFTPASAQVKGIAVSKGDGTLHLAVGDHLIEIPVDSIDSVEALGGHPNAVSVTVSDPARVRSIDAAASALNPVGGGDRVNVQTLTMSTFSAGNASDTPIFSVDDPGRPITPP
jgi:hypothetical protein